MYSKFLLLLTTLILATTFWISCDDEPQTCSECGHWWEPEVGAIQIVTGTPRDTLVFLPNDSASTTVTVIVTDTRGLALPGVKVAISLANPSLGVIEYVDDALRDTTNALGRVNTIFHTYGQAGDQLISATAGGVTAQRILVIRQSEFPVNNLTLTATPSIVIADSGEIGQTMITAVIRDGLNVGIANVLLDVTTSGGTVIGVTPTDSTGRTTFFWNFYNEFGVFTIYAQAGSHRDSLMVEVRLPEPEPYAGEYSIFSTISADTLWFLPGDSTFAYFSVFVFDTLGFPAPGVRVNIELANPMLGYIEFTNQSLRDTTNTIGSVSAIYRSYAVAGDQIITPCVRDSCAPIHFTIREIQPEPPQVSVYTIPLTLRVDSNTVGTALIRVVAQDENGILLPGITPTLSVEAGEFDPPPPTDSNGESETEWHFFNQFDRFQVTAMIEYNGQAATDNTLINVVYGP